MDRKRKLKNDLKGFVKECKAKGYPLTEYCLKEAYPGDSSTSFILQVKADWIDNKGCSEVLDILLEVLWNTTSPEVRVNLFSIQVLSSNDTVHCEFVGEEEEEDTIVED